MRFNWKVFGIAFASILVVLGIGAFALWNGIGGSFVASKGDAPLPLPKEGNITAEDRKSLEMMTQKSARVNVLVAGTDGGRSDMMMVMSYDPIRKLTDIISVPRDTYHKMPGYDGPGMYKINAAYALRGDKGGIERTRKEIESILHVPIHYTVDLNYNAVRDVVNVLGGVDVEVKRAMKYDDPYCDPPLHIDLQPGIQRLDGDKAIQFLRWRKNNHGYGEGDIQRIERQHQFVKDAIAKAFGIKLPAVIKAASTHIKTDMPLDQMLYYAGTSIGMDQAQTRSYRLPGTTATINKLSYFVSNQVDTETMMLSIYNRQTGETPIEGTITSLKQLGLQDTETVLPEKPSKSAESKTTKKTKKKTESKDKKPSTDSNVITPDQPVVDPSTPSNNEPTAPVVPDTTDASNLGDVSNPNAVPSTGDAVPQQ